MALTIALNFCSSDSQMNSKIDSPYVSTQNLNHLDLMRTHKQQKLNLRPPSYGTAFFMNISNTEKTWNKVKTIVNLVSDSHFLRN